VKDVATVEYLVHPKYLVPLVILINILTGVLVGYFFLKVFPEEK